LVKTKIQTGMIGKRPHKEESDKRNLFAGEIGQNWAKTRPPNLPRKKYCRMGAWGGGKANGQKYCAREKKKG